MECYYTRFFQVNPLLLCIPPSRLHILEYADSLQE
nr:MAG TPA: hypothetical protein [Caudoviricetes sp.]